MRTHYLHLSAYSCDNCGGPVVAGSIAVRENEISKETDVREVGAICLSCGHRQSNRTGLDSQLSTYAMGVTESDRGEPWHDRLSVGGLPL